MLKLYISNKIETLSLKFAKNIKTNNNIFSSELLVMQTSGMERWLSLQTAKENGIFTNFQFIKPNSFINRLYELAEIKASNIYSTENLKWLLYKYLGNEEFISNFKQVAQYYEDDDIKRLQLSVKLADLFDQYLLYRQSYIESWNDNKLAKISIFPDDDPLQIKNKQNRLDQHQKWQFWIWRKIKNELDEEGLDKVQLRDILIKKLDNKGFQDKIKEKFGTISLFGLSVITDYHIEIFYRLSEFLDVNLYFLNPAPDTYWYDIVSEKFMYYLVQKTGQSAEELKQHVGNELLSNYSALAKDTYNILFKTDDFVNAIDDSLTISPNRNTLLEKIQDDIFYNKNKEERNSISLENLNDNSIVISSSYTPMREIEALYNQILFFLKQDPTIEAQDIIVQLSDVDLYTPYIRAVFDNAPHSLPYTIADRSYTGGDTIVGVLESILKLNYEDFTSEHILQFLNSEFIRNKFGINNINLIRETVREANIRFGIKGNNDDDTLFVSWKYGLERILLGYAIKGGEDFSLGKYGTFPLDTIEGSDSEELLKFIGFVNILITNLDDRKGDRSLKEWSNYINKTIDNLIAFDKNANAEIKYIQKHLESICKMNNILKEGNKDLIIGFEVFQKSFIDALFSNPRAGNFITGGITFCSMIPMRSIPFKVSALIGLNGDKFPRQDSKLAFNLVDIEYKRGDRNTKNNDKYLFLESILSSRKHLYLSYVGNSTKDNTDIPPSLLIEELKSYIQLGLENNIKEYKLDKYLVQKHPLHSFSQKYFSESKNIFTFNENQFTQNIKKENENNNPSERSINNIRIDELIIFFEDPFKYYYNKILQIYYREDESLLGETELFSLDHLQEWSIKNKLLVSEIDTEKYIDKAKKTGMLPLANMARVVLEEVEEKIKDLKETFLKLSKEYTPESENINLKLGKYEISSSIFPIYNNKYIAANVSGSSSQAKYLLRAWLKHLIIIASGKEIETLYLSDENNPPLIWRNNKISTQIAQSKLIRLIEIFLEGQQRIIAFEPNIGKNLCVKLIKISDNQEKKEIAINQSINALNALDTPSFGLGIYNQYIQKESQQGFFENKEKIYKELEEISTLIFEDLQN